MKSKCVKKLQAFFTLTILTMCAAVLVFAAPLTEADDGADLQEELSYGQLRYVVSAGAVTIKSCSTQAVNVEIPETIDGMPVTALGYQAFRNCKDLASVIIPAGVKSFASGGAFYGCESLTSAGPIGGDYAIQFGWTEAIPAYAFADCGGLQKAVIPDTITEIGGHAFFNCGSLAEIVIPAGVSKVGDGAFYGCESLTSAGPIGGDYSVQFGWTETLPSKALNDLKGLELLVVPDGAKWSNFLYGKEHLKTAGPAGGDYDIQLGQMEEVPAQMFKESSLVSIVLPSKVMSVGDYAFANSRGLKTVEFPDKLVSIGSCAFDNCEALEGKLVLPDSVNTLGTHVFRNCSSLEEVALPSGITTLESGTFSKCTGLRRAVIPDGVTQLGRGSGYVFEYCSNLESVTIPAGCSIFGYSTFRGCDKLKSAGPIGGDYNIQFGWTEAIPGNAFQDCSALELVVIPASVAQMPYTGAFSGCPGLKTAGPVGGGYNIQFGWTDTIPASAFQSCTSLEEVIVPAGITAIKDSAFNNCPALRSATLNEGLLTMGVNSFGTCKSLETIELPASLNSFDYRAFTGCTALAEINVRQGNEVYSSERGVVFSADKKTLIICPPGFAGEKYTIPDTVEKIGNNAFSGNQGLTEVIIPESVNNIGLSAFRECQGLQRVTIPDSVTYLGANAFYNCPALAEAELSANLGQFNGNEFERCPGLTIKSHERTWAKIYAMDYGIAWESLGVYEPTVVYYEPGDYIDWSKLGNHTKILLPDGTYPCISVELKACDISIEAENPGRAELLSKSDDSPVLPMRQSAYVDITGLIMGHEQISTDSRVGCGASIPAYSDQNAAHVLVATGSRFISVDRCDLWGCGLTSIFLSRSRDIAVKDSVLRDCVFGAVYSSESEAAFENCVISGNAYHEEYRDRPCIYLNNTYDNSDYPTDVSFKGCEFYGNYNPKLIGGQIMIKSHYEDRDGINVYIPAGYTDIDEGRYFTDCVFHDNAWDGGIPGMYGICAVGRVTWQITADKDGKMTLVMGKDISFADGGTYKGVSGETPLYSEYSLPWARYIKEISSYSLIPGVCTYLPANSQADVVLDLAASGVPAGSYTLVKAVFSSSNANDGGRMDTVLLEKVDFDGAAPLGLSADSPVRQITVFMLLSEDGSVPACGRTSLQFVHVR